MTVRLFESEICECLCFITIVIYSLEVSMMKPLTLDAYCFFLGSSFWRGRGERFCADVFCLSLSNKEVGTNGFWAIELVLSASCKWSMDKISGECLWCLHSLCGWLSGHLRFQLDTSWPVHLPHMVDYEGFHSQEVLFKVKPLQLYSGIASFILCGRAIIQIDHGNISSKFRWADSTCSIWGELWLWLLHIGFNDLYI